MAGDRLQALCIVDAVLQAENGGLRPQASGERAAGLLGIGGFDAHQHQIGRGQRGGVGRGLGGQVSFESFGVEQQAMGIDGVDMLLPADEGHVMPGPQQQSPVIASDRAGTDDRDFHALLLPYALPKISDNADSSRSICPSVPTVIRK